MVADHCGVYLWLPGFAAVKCFFVVSGFLISHVFVKYSSWSDFFKSRFLRLFPVYWATMILSLIYFELASRNSFVPKNPQPFGETFLERIFQFLQNLTIFTSDLNWFFRSFYRDGYSNVDHLIIPPIWSVALELYFYLMLPLLIRFSTRKLVVLVICVFFLQSTLYSYGFNSEPWHARFFIFELPYFVFGMLSYRSLVLFQNLFRNPYLRYSIFFVLFASIVVDSFLIESLPVLYENNFYLYGCFMALLIALFLPSLFLQGNSQIGKYLGDLSYLIYLWHYTFVTLIKSSNYTLDGFTLVLSLSVLHGIITRELIGRRIEKYRAKRYRTS